MSMTIWFKRPRNLHFFPRYQTLWAFIVILIVSLWVLNANPFTGQTAGPFDLLLAQPAWGVAEWDEVRNNKASDVLDSELPSWVVLKEQIRAGKGALWFPHSAGGKAMDIEPFNPAFLLFLAVKDNAFAFYLVVLFKLVIAGFGGYLLLRTFLQWAPSLWGGVVFMLCGFNIAWLYVEQVTTSMWIPWLLAATVMYLRTEDRKWLPAITLTASLLIFGGFFSVAAFGLYAFGLLVLTWNAYDFLVHDRQAPGKDISRIRVFLKKTVFPMVAVSIAFLLAAIILMPFIDGLNGVNLSYRKGGTYFRGIQDLLLLFTYEYPLQLERTIFIGIPVGVFAFLGVLGSFRTTDENYRKFIFFHILLVIISILIAFGILPHDFIRALPVFGNNTWSRLTVILLLSLSVLSAIGLDFCIKELPAFLSRYKKLSPLIARRIAALIVIAAALFQLGSQKTFFNDSVAVVPSSWFYPLTPSIEYVKEHLKPLQSIIADDSFLVSGTLGPYGISEWYGHALRPDTEKAVLSKMVMLPFVTPTAASFNAARILYNSHLMDKMAIKYILVNKAFYQEADRHTIGEKWGLIDLDKKIAVLENKNVTNGAYFVKDLDAANEQLDFSNLDVRRPSSDEIDVTYSNGGPGWVVLPMHLHRGWKASIDNRPVEYDTYLDILPAIPVTGPGRIVFSYQPVAFRAGLSISLIGFCILLAFSAWCFKKEKKV